MARRGVRVTDAQWATIEPLLPRMPRTARGGRPWASHRPVVDGILWVLKTGARWRDLPAEYPSPSTCWRRLKRWDEDGTWLRVWRAIIAELDGAWPVAVGDRVHRWHVRLGKKGGSDIGPTKRGKGSKCMVLVERQGIPVGITITSASPTEVTLAEATLKTRVTPHRRNPKHLLGDRAYDSDPLRQRLAARGIVLTSPYRSNNLHCRYEDGRRLRTYRHRWIIERTIAWFGAFRRLLVRYERSTRMFLAFFQFAAALIALRRL